MLIIIKIKYSKTISKYIEYQITMTLINAKKKATVAQTKHAMNFKKGF